MHRIHITREQAKKLAKGGSINVSLEQIHNPSHRHNHILEFDSHKKLHDHKGFRLRSEDIHGGTISLADFKGPVAKAIMQKGAEKIINSIPNNVLGKNQKQSANILASNLINNNNQKQTISTINGLGFHEHHHEMHHEHHHHEKGKGIRLIKGSEEAKEHMRKLREMKKDKGGSLKSVGNAIKNYAKQEWNNDKEAGKAIFLQPNVAQAGVLSLATGEPLPLIGAIGSNTANYMINKYTKNKTNLVSSKNVSDAYKAQQKANGAGIEKRKRGRPKKVFGTNIIPIGSGLYY